MKRIGLIGGMSWESSTTYYQAINREIRRRLGGLHSAECILFSLDFHEIESYQTSGEWGKAAAKLVTAARYLESAGADFIILCTNTMHRCAEEISSSIAIPFLHIAEATADSILEKGLKKVALLGTSYTMEQTFYTSVLKDKRLHVMVPDELERKTLNDIIFKELCVGNIKEKSRVFLLELISKLNRDGAEGVILGCTEIGLLLHEHDIDIPLFDTTIIHATKAVELSLRKD